MANLPEPAEWQAGIYQIETTDPVMGGPDGIANLQAKQLAARTAFLKKTADEVTAARGGAASLSDRISDMEDLPRTRFSSGKVVIKNKHVVSGFLLSKTDIRALHLSASGTVGGGESVARLDGQTVRLSDDDYAVSVPTNPTPAPVTLYAYLSAGVDGYKVRIGAEVPDNGLLLYRLTLPANDGAADLGPATLTDQRVVQAASHWLQTLKPSVVVSLPVQLPHADYTVLLEVDSATQVDAVGELRIASRATNGFRIEMTGSADNVVVRWVVMNPAAE